jgi:hypothetical protein
MRRPEFLSRRHGTCLGALGLVLLPLALLPAGEGERPSADKQVISTAKRDDDGFLVHTIRSEYQDGPTKIKVLLPDRLDKGRRYPVLYVLPVEAGDGNRYGDGLREIKKLDLHNKHGLICVLPTFARLPWYADHPTDARLRQETYLLRVVLAFVEKTYPALGKMLGRLLLGFSKSGWGAFTLLLRHPDVFGKAAAWDAPLAMAEPGKYGSGEIFATPANFAKYRVTALLERQAGKLGAGERLAVLGYGGFRQEHIRVHELMRKLDIPRLYRDGPSRKHDWHSGWVPEAVEFLAAPLNVKQRGSNTMRSADVNVGEVQDHAEVSTWGVSGL